MAHGSSFSFLSFALAALAVFDDIENPRLISFTAVRLAHGRAGTAAPQMGRTLCASFSEPVSAGTVRAAFGCRAGGADCSSLGRRRFNSSKMRVGDEMLALETAVAKANEILARGPRNLSLPCQPD